MCLRKCHVHSPRQVESRPRNLLWVRAAYDPEYRSTYGNTAGHLELYDLEEDPKEKENVARSEETIGENTMLKLECSYRQKVAWNPDPLPTQPVSMPIGAR